MSKNPTQPLTQVDFDAITSITAYYENNLEGPDFIFPPIRYSLSNAMNYSGNPNVARNINTYAMWDNIIEHGEGVDFSRKDVGALFRYSKGNHTSFVTTEYLLRLPQRKNLTDAQLHEIEHLLNKADRTLGASLPPLPVATDASMKEALFALLAKEIEARPKYFYQNFIDLMAQKGTPVDVTNKDFRQLVTTLLNV